MPKFIDPVFVKTSPKSLFSLIENERYGHVFRKLGLKIRAQDYFRGSSTPFLCS
jgi:hypothetical protein